MDRVTRLQEALPRSRDLERHGCLHESQHEEMETTSSQTRRAADSKPLSLQGPRPEAMAVDRSSTKTVKKRDFVPATATHHREPVTKIVYLRSPKVIHVKPDEFMGLVQQLTGNQSSSLSASSVDDDAVEVNTT